ncbi:ImmA/IrrE family metallo-endopeptidase [Yoonia sp. SDW83-1]|uniref:ImmA/IrrE family metallo-endopeptidase n=1 Tax=Yoonia sp. SDW83-1 TaxID=3366945 RepID=UPI00398C6D33
MASNEMNRVAPEHRDALNRFLTEHPVKLGQLATALGVRIKVSSLGAGVSGQISREDGGYVIRVNRNEARERQRFTIGHELAHFLLHRDVIDASPNGITDTVLYRSGEPERIEFEANRLAADIVMPMELVERELQEGFGGRITEASIEALANRFEVSKAAMEIRLSNFVAA